MLLVCVCVCVCVCARALVYVCVCVFVCVCVCVCVLLLSICLSLSLYLRGKHRGRVQRHKCLEVLAFKGKPTGAIRAVGAFITAYALLSAPLQALQVFAGIARVCVCECVGGCTCIHAYIYVQEYRFS